MPALWARDAPCNLRFDASAMLEPHGTRSTAVRRHSPNLWAAPGTV